jgi:bifunctional non-homologous end joining protein LigD
LQSRKCGFKIHAGRYDGTRCLIIKDKGEVTLQNRHGIIYTVRLPEIVEAAKAIPGSFIIDGEVVYINPETGMEEFTPCQRRCSTQFPNPLLIRKYPVTFMAFDIIKLGGEYVVDKPYWKRKTLLRGLISKSIHIQFVPYRRDVENAWQEVVEKQREGLILKDFNSRYALGERSWSWLKVKNWRVEECEVVGYTFSSKGRPFGSLVLAKDGKFRGCVGSGFSDYELLKIMDILRSSPETPKPFPETVVGESYKAVKTGLRVLVQYYEATESGVLRHPVYLKTL